MNNITFLCELPPPFGGVTVKNRLILDNVVKSSDNIKVIDFCEIKRNPIKLVSVFSEMIRAFFHKNTIIYGFGSYKRLKQALRLQSTFGGKDSLCKTVNIVMGGRFQEYIKADSQLCALLKSIKLNLVETEGMKKAFVSLGVENAKVVPNARIADMSRKPVVHEGTLKCVFFSKIGRDKGVDYIISEYAEAEGITLDFYGHIDDDIKIDFEQFIDSHSYTHYNGVFDAGKNDVYTELNKYDVLLLPTKWKGEGVPGILVEAKMAGITSIVSDQNYNAEIVIDNMEGIVLPNLNKGTLYRATQELAIRRDKLIRLKNGAYYSRLRYAMESYTDQLREDFGLEE